MGKRILILLCFFINCNFIAAQQDDFQSWIITSLSKKINSEYTGSIVMINRFTENISKYNSVSVDWKVKRKLQGNFSAQVSFRHWTFTDRKPVYFMWYDVIHLHKNSKHRWMNLLRFHQGLDWVGREQADFIRWRNYFFQNINESKFTPFIGYDLWYRINGLNSFQNIWVELGSEYKLEKTKLRLNYRLMNPLNNSPFLKRHLIVVSSFHQF